MTSCSSMAFTVRALLVGTDWLVWWRTTETCSSILENQYIKIYIFKKLNNAPKLIISVRIVSNLSFDGTTTKLVDRLHVRSGRHTIDILKKNTNKKTNLLPLLRYFITPFHSPPKTDFWLCDEEDDDEEKPLLTTILSLWVKYRTWNYYIILIW